MNNLFSRALTVISVPCVLTGILDFLGLSNQWSFWIIESWLHNKIQFLYEQRYTEIFFIWQSFIAKTVLSVMVTRKKFKKFWEDNKTRFLTESVQGDCWLATLTVTLLTRTVYVSTCETDKSISIRPQSVSQCLQLLMSMFFSLFTSDCIQTRSVLCCGNANNIVVKFNFSAVTYSWVQKHFDLFNSNTILKIFFYLYYSYGTNIL